MGSSEQLDERCEHVYLEKEVMYIHYLPSGSYACSPDHFWLSKKRIIKPNVSVIISGEDWDAQVGEEGLQRGLSLYSQIFAMTARVIDVTIAA